MTPNLNRRQFTSLGAASLAALSIGAAPQKPTGKRRPVVVASGNVKTAEIAMDLLTKGADPLDAAIAGVAIVEADPNEHSVGLGGTPNEEGVVELDASVMHGPTHGGAGVAGLRNIVHPAAVARCILKRTRHVLMVGDNALKFAREHGFPEQDLLTEDTRKAWIAWKEARLRGARIPENLAFADPVVRELVQRPVHGTIHCSCLDTHGDLGCVTTTSGLGYKVPGRVGDSPILGAGIWLDNGVGSCGSVGLGEVNLLNCASFLVVENLRRGLKPKDALVATTRQVVETSTRDPRFRDEKGKPAFDVVFYLLTKDGKYAAANIHGPARLVVADGDGIREVDSAALLD
ncbi:N(4)-(Beta-N-acetylglucosaminyl)-L-asparaginase precursor [Aquisphaera giovannonii]|uniref:N(4)-(Beta-N-acetylglucosaminyl)-L-asparaginase n=1 Tax=Aquisphaera giovannonii TaxID=406548 RepID=A0A5B9VUU6_9BACT|nr:isoaspartyl peptidase/L-asparaginase [Aquisphaera giovannonii]QEH32163.1 N(4)-(Beta-N-acetylglucosaminyl)-L-asparaginase precursor [Aquisphaera giovannonii]